MRHLLLITLLSVLGVSCGKKGSDGAPGKNGAPGAAGTPGSDGSDGSNGSDGEDGKNGYQSYTAKHFVVINKIPYSIVSTSNTQLDTLCVNLTGRDPVALQAKMDATAQNIGGDFEFWYNEYKKNDQDYVSNCLGPFPKSFTSVRTGDSHTVNNNAECRAVTSNLVSTEYVEYLEDGGVPVTIPAKIKTSGCAGGVAPFIDRIQSVDGSMLSDYLSI